MSVQYFTNQSGKKILFAKTQKCVAQILDREQCSMADLKLLSGNPPEDGILAKLTKGFQGRKQYFLNKFKFQRLKVSSIVFPRKCAV